MLSPDRRSQLDGIVQKMVANKESDSNIQFVVDDFKKKYTDENQPISPTNVQTIPSLSQKLGEDFTQRAQNVLDAAGRQVSGQQGTAATTFQTLGQGAGALNDIGSEVYQRLSPFIPQFLKDKAKNILVDKFHLNAPIELGDGTSTTISQIIKHGIDNLSQGAGTFSQEHPVAAADLGAATNLGLAYLGGKQLVEAPGKLGNVLKNATENLAKSNAEKTAVNELTTIQDTISPKPTVKEARLAQSEGRLIKGNEPTLLKSGTADTVLPSEKTIQSAKTIQENIPNAAKMNQTQLYNALDKKTAEIAQSLQPEMQKVHITPSTIEKVNNAWDELKKVQLDAADATDEPNIRKIQDQFQARLTALRSKKATLNDLWEARKAYDASISANVKNANSLSSEVLQSRKSLWLDNRAILNNAIHDSESGLGSTSQKAFSDMHDMYNAKQNLQSTAKIETKIQPSKLRQALNSPTGKVLKTVAKVGLGVEGIKSIIK